MRQGVELVCCKVGLARQKAGYDGGQYEPGEQQERGSQFGYGFHDC